MGRAVRTATVLALLLAAARVPAADTSGLKLYAQTEHLTVYAGDAADYVGMVAALEQQYRRLVAKYDLRFDRRIEAYVYPDQLAFVRKVFGWTTVETNVAGLADHVSRRLFLTSIHDPCKPPEHMRKMPLHELTHVLLPSGMVWVREGAATYEAGMLAPVEAASVPRTLGGMPFYRGDDDTAKAYNLAGWLVKFIVEELLRGEAPRFVRFARAPTDWAAIGVTDERDLMDRWRAWMASRAPAAPGR